ncbi:A disintegrin and metalloproteinase with thrombospondin motifs gon-1-like isoform X2 [Styela clava]
MTLFQYNIYSLIYFISFTVSQGQAQTSKNVKGVWGPWKNITRCEIQEIGPGQVQERECFVGNRVVDKQFCNGLYKLVVECQLEQLAIVHGIKAEFGNWPWQVFIEIDNGKDQCGGSLIEDMWILTAAHCFMSGRKKATRVTLSAINKHGMAENAVNTIPERVVCHEDFDSIILKNDICLMKIPWIEYMGFARPVHYHMIPNLQQGSNCIVTGWGYDENSNLPDNLQQAEVTVIEKKQCREWYKKLGTTIPQGTICAGHIEGGPDSCGGDSGGPLVCKVNNGPHFLYGVTSFGPVKCGAKKSPGIYTSVSDFIPWIAKTMESSLEGYHWGEWNTTCSVTCGKGQMAMQRKCLNKEGDTVNNDNCPGQAHKVGDCNLPRCIAYSWEPWKGECSVTCGEGTLERARKCLNEDSKPVNSKHCGGGPTEQKAKCFNVRPCQESVYQWSSWVSSSCSVTCGVGNVIKRRHCTSNNEISDAAHCKGNSGEILFCTGPTCEEISTWGPWISSSCSVTCGDGTTKRTRHCLTKTTAAKGSNCPGKAEDIRPCSELPCKVYSWGPWLSFSCSVTCGNGKITKMRQCMSNISGKRGDSCSGNSQVTEACVEPPCKNVFSWGPWLPPSACSVTCGKGENIRKRHCLSAQTMRRGDFCAGEAEEVASCSMPVCKEFHWSQWKSTCSVTCGMGTEEGSRICLDDNNRSVKVNLCIGRSRIIRTCTRDKCREEYHWSQWKKVCSVTCGSGTEESTRICLNKDNKSVRDNLCDGTSRLSGTCSRSPCPPEYHWSQWKNVCSVTCGSGTEESTRSCLNKENRPVPDSQCNGKSRNFGTCDRTACREKYHWTAWRKTCSVSCGKGSEKNTRTCLNENNRLVSSSFCNGRSQFSSTCDLTPCRAVSGYHWSEWKVTCSVTCGRGAEYKSRDCLDGKNIPVNLNLCKGRSHEERECVRAACPTNFNWGEWIGICSVTCNTGIEIRRRECFDTNINTVDQEKCVGSAFSTATCSLGPCSDFHWGTWERSCSVTCGSGIEHIRRSCLDTNENQVNENKCQGHASQRGECRMGPCEESRGYHWGAWKNHCSVTCGKGVEHNIRDCLDGNKRPVTTSLCNGNSHFSDTCIRPSCKTVSVHKWGPWQTKCSVTCGAGDEVKIRVCMDGNGKTVSNDKCPRGPAIQQGACFRSSCKLSAHKWGPWQTKCSVTCGAGDEVKIRVCMDGNGKTVSNDKCPRGPAIQQGACFRSSCKRQFWGPWSTFSDCSASCGGGLRTRTRRCTGGPGSCGAGESTISVQCNTDACRRGGVDLYEWGEWKSWSRCRLKSSSRNRCSGFQSSTRACYNRDKDVSPHLCGSSSENYKERICQLPDC